MSDYPPRTLPETETSPEIEQALQELDQVATGLGYVKVSSLSELGLTQEQIQQFSYIDKTRRTLSERYYRAQREDNAPVQAVVKAHTIGNYEAELFSPVYYEGHHTNHDFSLENIESQLQIALTNTASKDEQK